MFIVPVILTSFNISICLFVKHPGSGDLCMGLSFCWKTLLFCLNKSIANHYHCPYVLISNRSVFVSPKTESDDLMGDVKTLPCCSDQGWAT